MGRDLYLNAALLGNAGDTEDTLFPINANTSREIPSGRLTYCDCFRIVAAAEGPLELEACGKSRIALTSVDVMIAGESDSRCC